MAPQPDTPTRLAALAAADEVVPMGEPLEPPKTVLKFFPHGVLAIGMLVAGSINTIAYKVADWQNAQGIYYPDQCNWTIASWEPPPPAPPPLPLSPWKVHSPPAPPPESPSPAPAPPPDMGNGCLFIHPFFQVYAMFLGECLCLLAFIVLRCLGKVEPAPPFNPLVFLPCALCDTCGTSLMMLGLLLTYASAYQMLRGSVVIFTGLFSRIFLKRALNKNNYAGLGLVLLGTIVVGLDQVIYPQVDASASNPALGNILIVGAQVVVAVQMICEEFFIADKNIPPLCAVGAEGVFGMLTLSVIMLIAYNVPGVDGLSLTPDKLDDIIDALHQTFLGGNGVLTGSMVLVCLSIAFFNFFGISVTKQLSAAHRMVLDSSRAIVVWIFSLATGQNFGYLQLIGFIVLVCGSLVYYEIVTVESMSRKKKRGSEFTEQFDAPMLSSTSVQSDQAA